MNLVTGTSFQVIVTGSFVTQTVLCSTGDHIQFNQIFLVNVTMTYFSLCSVVARINRFSAVTIRVSHTNAATLLCSIATIEIL